jgi:hypothetical protein
MVSNAETNADNAECTLSTGDVSDANIGPLGSDESIDATLSVQDTVTLSTPTSITMSCETTNANANSAKLTAIAVDQLN